MFATHIGKRLLQLYNARTGQALSARQFFDREFFPLFYDHDRYLQCVSNSPFDQLYKQKGHREQNRRTETLKKFHTKIAGDSPDGSFAVGFPAADFDATTSGQVSNIQIPFAEEDLYASWVGSGLGVGVQGGLVIYLDVDEVLLALFDGWKLYREVLDQLPSLKSNQIDTWNGQWVTHVLSPNYRADYPTSNFRPYQLQRDGSSLVPTQSWIKVLFALSRRFQSRFPQVTAYVYSLGQMNKTLGFIQVNLQIVA